MTQQNQLPQIIDLIKKTGDKAIVLDGDKPAYVVMALKDYERLLLDHSEVRGLTENELLDKINREVGIWKSDQERVKEIEDGYTGGEDEQPWERGIGLTDDIIGDRIDRDYDFDELKDDFDDFEMKDDHYDEPWDFEEDKYYVEPVR